MLGVVSALIGAQGKDEVGEDESRKSQKTQCILVTSKPEKCQKDEPPVDSTISVHKILHTVCYRIFFPREVFFFSFFSENF